jgi:uncharacterized membrane protein
MGIMHRRKLLRTIDPERIKTAIQEAEKRTSGEIRVSVSQFFWGKVRPVAEHAFRRLGIANTKDRNGIFFFIVPSRRRFVVLGDEGIHAKVGQDFWDNLTAGMSGEFRKGRFQEGLLKAIADVGVRLAAHFPYDPAADKNELSDEVDFSRKR